MKIYTKTGDGGQTGLYGGTRVSKTSQRIAAIGSVDEANAALGVAAELSKELGTTIRWIQSRLFDVGAELASLPEARVSSALLTPSAISKLESSIDEMEPDLPLLKNFILPGGTPAAAALHVARATVRRAERDVIALSESENAQIRPDLIVFLNRLSDWCFMAARWANFAAGTAEVPWKGEGNA
jgi:cob(I)alamin adenosyltransferase